MTVISETLEIEEVRKDIVRYTLKSEIFYAFPVSYYITLLNRIQAAPNISDLKDFLKTI